jgi:hypothetical protein
MMKRVGEWKQAIAVTARMAQRGSTAIDRAIHREAQYYRRLVNQAFVKQGLRRKWKPISLITRQMRRNASKIGVRGSRGTKALIRSGDMRRSVAVYKRGSADYFVGIHRSSKRAQSGGKKSTSYFNVAKAHEMGPTLIPITNRMRRFFRYLYWKGVIQFPWPPAKATYILIPKRSFLQDAYDQLKVGAQRRILLRVAKELKLPAGKLASQ